MGNDLFEVVGRGLNVQAGELDTQHYADLASR